MTHKLYYDDAYIKSFCARVLRSEKTDSGASRILLDKTAFYPTGGGQPCDFGTINGFSVTDVQSNDVGEVWHLVSGDISEGEEISGEIDWLRRFDHMQQHAGEHMLAGSIHRLCSGRTIGLHLGADDSTIDVEFANRDMRVPDSVLYELEDDVNSRIQNDEPIRCWFPSREELATLPLRKPPTVETGVRVVSIGKDEYCACGGTHPSSAGQIGLVKIIDARPSRGKMRVTFLCGMRAFRDYRARFNVCREASAKLSTSYENLPETVRSLSERVKNAEYKLSKEKLVRALDGCGALIKSAQDVKGIKVVSHIFSELPADALSEVANTICANCGYIALLASEADGNCFLAFARSGDVSINAGALLTESARAFGGKGGGKAEFARGSCASAEAIEYAFTKIQSAFD